ncbi:MAG: hypothetical protein RR052_00455 [Oscillospiraceae bacterium]
MELYKKDNQISNSSLASFMPEGKTDFTLFSESGCLTDEGLQAIINDKLNEMQSLEASEHLAFCDKCLLRYTNALDTLPEDKLQTPETDIVKGVMQRIKERATRIFFNRYVTVVAAACFAIIMTATGIFGNLTNVGLDRHKQIENKIASNEKYSNFTSNTNEFVQELFGLTFIRDIGKGK